MTGTELWRIDVGVNPVTGLAVRGNRLFGVATGSLFVIDLTVPEIIYENGSAPIGGAPTLEVDRGLIYGQSSSQFFRIHPVGRYRIEVLARIRGDWFSGPRLAVGAGNYHYTLDGRDLVRIRDRSSRA